LMHRLLPRHRPRAERLSIVELSKTRWRKLPGFLHADFGKF
jgi:hypothetical protein